MEILTGTKPEALTNMPKLLAHQNFYLNAFYSISEWRGYLSTGGLAPLTLAEVLVYCQMFKIESLELRDTLVSHIKRLDIAYMQKRAARAKQDKTEKSDT